MSLSMLQPVSSVGFHTPPPNFVTGSDPLKFLRNTKRRLINPSTATNTLMFKNDILKHTENLSLRTTRLLHCPRFTTRATNVLLVLLFTAGFIRAVPPTEALTDVVGALAAHLNGNGVLTAGDLHGAGIHLPTADELPHLPLLDTTEAVLREPTPVPVPILDGTDGDVWMPDSAMTPSDTGVVEGPPLTSGPDFGTDAPGDRCLWDAADSSVLHPDFYV